MTSRDGVGIVGGTGRLGSALAVRWARAGHRVVLGSRDPARAHRHAAGLATRWPAAAGRLFGGALAEAAEAALVVIAVPYPAHDATLRAVGPLLGDALVLDCTVPLAMGPGGIPRVEARSAPAAALEARAVLGPAVRLVAGLHTVSHMALSDPEAAVGSDAWICGDDAADRRAAARWITDLGLRTVDAGPLRHAIALEGMVAVLVHVNRAGGHHAGLRITGLGEASR